MFVKHLDGLRTLWSYRESQYVKSIIHSRLIWMNILAFHFVTSPSRFKGQTSRTIQLYRLIGHSSLVSLSWELLRVIALPGLMVSKSHSHVSARDFGIGSLRERYKFCQQTFIVMFVLYCNYILLKLSRKSMRELVNK